MTHTSPLRLLVLHALRLKGVAEADVIAAVMDTDVSATRDELAELEALGLATYRYGRIPGFKQTPEGRAYGEALLREELDQLGARAAMVHAYDGFLDCNGELLAVCTAWQLREVDGESQVNDHADSAYDASVLARLTALHERVDPVLASMASCLARFDGHRRRLRTALERVLAGDHDYFTKPMFPSYHSIWFELHEDLLATLGTERTTEGKR
jgi:predicted ArsR family transcriptional regulator